MSDEKPVFTIGTMTGGIAIGARAQATGAGGAIHNAADLATLLAAIRPHLATLPPDRRSAVEDMLTGVEREARMPQPDRGKIRNGLQSVRAVCEGIVGSLIATYISQA